MPRNQAPVPMRPYDLAAHVARYGLPAASGKDEWIVKEFSIAAYEMQRPSVLYRPTVAPDGTKWCALYGPHLMEGVSGYGDTPAEAMADFDKNWLKQKTPMATHKCARCGHPNPDNVALAEGCRDPDCPERG